MSLEKINEYKKSLGMTTEELSKRSGVPVGTLNKILSGATKDPKFETLKAIAKALGLSLSDFDDSRTYYENDDTAAIAQEILENRELRVLFDAARDASPEDLQTTYEMLMALKRKEMGDSNDPA